MASNGEQLTMQLQQDLCCPQCQYSLRGLPGTVVTCPECGLVCDISKMIANRWTGPWQTAPGYSQLLYPVSLISMWSLVLLVAFAIDVERFNGTGVLTISLGGFGGVIWLGLMWSVSRRFQDAGGAWLALATHILLVGYVSGIVLFITAIVRSFGRIDAATLALHGMILLVSVALLFACRRGERAVAEQCIRQFLLQRTLDDVNQPLAGMTPVNPNC